MKIQLPQEKESLIKTTYVTFVLDDSASMSGVRVQTLDGFNEQLTAVKGMVAPDHKVFVSVVIFSDPDKIKTVRSRVPAGEVPALTLDEYRTAGGSTALLDAIYTAINHSNIEDATVGKNAGLLIIMTDGQENNSKVIRDKSRIKEMIDGLSASDHWTITYMGIGSANEIAGDYGISHGNITQFASGVVGAALNTISNTKGLGSYYSSRVMGHTVMDSFYANEEDEKNNVAGS